jgi:glycosyltransferase involved in cell wall biosynthesis
VEAMAAGAVPIVLGKGGQKEIVEPGKNGLWWFKKEELITETLKLISNEEKMRGLAESAILRSKAFTKEKFKEEILSLTQK